MTPPYLVDTNIHLRAAQPGSTESAQVAQALELLKRQGAELVVALQNLVEFWSVATRPAAARGGLGLSVQQARRELEQICSLFRLLPDTSMVFANWKQILDTVGALGVQAHEARLVATMQANGIDHILTFNVTDFKRYQDITAVSPGEFIASSVSV